MPEDEICLLAVVVPPTAVFARRPVELLVAALEFHRPVGAHDGFVRRIGGW